MQKMQYSLCTLLLFLLAGVGLIAQVNHPTSGTVNETVTCGSSVTYYDSGGAGGNYSSSESGTVNFCPSTPGETVTIDFSLVDLETSSSGSGSAAGGCCWDALTISDANGTLFEGCGEDSGDGDDACGIDGGTNDLDPGDSFTSTATDGCLTVSFNSDSSFSEPGWEATVTCSGTPPPPSNDLNHPTSGTVNQTVTCGDDISYYDSGGPSGDYQNSESGTVNFCPSSPGSAVTIDFSAVDIETQTSSPGCWDFLTISDDNGTLFNGCGEDSGDGGNAGPGATDLDVGDSFTSTAANGCLTVSFDSDTSQPESGWAAIVSCEGGGGEPTLGCTDPNSCNYNPMATVDDGSCEYVSCLGCTDPGAVNYDPSATMDDGSCIYPPGNDECFDAITIFCGQTLTGSTEYALFDVIPSCEFDGEGEGEGEGGGSPMAPGVWYKFVGTGDEVTASLCDSDYDTMIGIYTGNCDGLLECVTANDDTDECGLQSEITFETEIGVTYYIHVNGYEDVGNFNLQLICGCIEEAPLTGGYQTTDINNGFGGSGGAYEDQCVGAICVESYGFPIPNADKAFYAYKCLCGDGEFIARVVEVTPSSARGGIMIRENNAPGSRKVAMKTAFTDNILLWRDIRVATNALQHSKNLPMPQANWLRLVRQGNYFIGYASQNGINWYFTFSQYIPMGTCIEAGLYVESPTVNTLGRACFDNVSTTAGSCDITLTAPITPDVAHVELESASDFDVYPNPAKDELNVRLDDYAGQQVTLTLTNNLGQVVKVRKLDSAEHTEQLNISDLVPGMYLISLKTSGDQVQTKKVVVK